VGDGGKKERGGNLYFLGGKENFESIAPCRKFQEMHTT
jgi:hypothetical protein